MAGSDHADARDRALGIIRDAVGNDSANRLVGDYFSVLQPERDGPEFTGAWFEHLYGGGDREAVADRFTAADLVAVTMLSVQVPPRAAVELLRDPDRRFGDLLRSIPVEASVENEQGQKLLREGDSPSHRLWRSLDGLHGIGWVTAGKLMARKRPALIPVYDNVVKTYLQAPDGMGFWTVCADAFRDDEIVNALTSFRSDLGLDRVSLLRILDVILWRLGRGDG